MVLKWRSCFKVGVAIKISHSTIVPATDTGPENSLTTTAPQLIACLGWALTKSLRHNLVMTWDTQRLKTTHSLAWLRNIVHIMSIGKSRELPINQISLSHFNLLLVFNRSDTTGPQGHFSDVLCKLFVFLQLAHIPLRICIIICPILRDLLVIQCRKSIIPLGALRLSWPNVSSLVLHTSGWQERTSSMNRVDPDVRILLSWFRVVLGKRLITGDDLRIIHQAGRRSHS